MRTMSLIVLALTSVLTVFCLSGFATEWDQEYYHSISSHYLVSAEVLDKVIATGIDNWYLPVVMHVAQRAKLSPVDVAKNFNQNKSWDKVVRSYGLNTEIFYPPVLGKFNSKTFNPIMTRFSETHKSQWKDIEFSNDEIANLVNAKFIASYHDFSILNIITIRDSGESYEKINNSVRIAKETALLEEKRNELKMAKLRQANDVE